MEMYPISNIIYTDIYSLLLMTRDICASHIVNPSMLSFLNEDMKLKISFEVMGKVCKIKAVPLESTIFEKPVEFDAWDPHYSGPRYNS